MMKAPMKEYVPNKKLKHTPNLLFLHMKSKVKEEMDEFQTFFNIAERKCYTDRIWQMQEYKCWPTSQEWIFMVNSYNKCILFSSFNKKSILLPSMKYTMHDHCVCVLSMRNENYIIMFVNYTRRCIFFFDSSSNEKKWVTYYYRDEVEEKNLSAVGSCNGQFYGVSSTHFLTIDCMPKPKITIMEPLDSSRLGFNCRTTHMLEARGDLYMVCKYYASASSLKLCALIVWKRNSPLKQWKIVDNIGDQVFFLGPSSPGAVWSAVDIGCKGNLIYYVERENKRLFCYDLEMATITVDIPCPRVKSRFCYPLWVCPAIKGL